MRTAFSGKKERGIKQLYSPKNFASRKEYQETGKEPVIGKNPGRLKKPITPEESEIIKEAFDRLKFGVRQAGSKNNSKKWNNKFDVITDKSSAYWMEVILRFRFFAILLIPYFGTIVPQYLFKLFSFINTSWEKPIRSIRRYKEMSRRNKNILAISVVMLLLLAFMVPSAIAKSDKDSERGEINNVKDSENVFDFGEQTGQEKIVKMPQLAWVRYGPITHTGYQSLSYYVPYGGCLSGTPVVVASLEIPWEWPEYSSQHHTVAIEKGWVSSCDAWVHVTSEDSASLTGSNINLIGIY